MDEGRKTQQLREKNSLCLSCIHALSIVPPALTCVQADYGGIPQPGDLDPILTSCAISMMQSHL